MSFGGVVLLADIPVRPIAVAVILVAFGAWVAFLLNLGAGGRGEKLPPNIKPYLTDDELEGRKVVNTGLLGMFTAVGLAVIMAVYWLALPKIQADAADRFLRESIQRGSQRFDVTGSNLKALNCAGCHGAGRGGKVDYILTKGPVKGQKVSWECPEIDNVYYRFTRDEVKKILIYGRPGTPMPPWGLSGGGPLTDQEIEDLLNYLKSIEIPADQAVKAAAADAQGNKITDGPTLFLKNCARCHTPNFSYTPADNRAALPQGVGAYGPSLLNETTQFPDPADQIEFIKNGSVEAKPYGVRGVGNGRMPGFAKDPDHPLLDDAQITAIAEYERGLHDAYGVADVKSATLTETAATTTAPSSTAAATTTSKQP